MCDKLCWCRYTKKKNKISVQTNEVGFDAIFKLVSRERNKVLINLGGYKIPIVYAGIFNRMNAISNSIVRTNKKTTSVRTAGAERMNISRVCKVVVEATR